MNAQYPTRDGTDIDPDLRRFMAMTSAAYADHPPLDTLTLPQARAVFEQVREPWRSGGPAMAATSDLTVETRHGGVRVRIHDPSPDSPKPALVYLHGGGWTIFSIDTHDRVMREYAARAGVVVVAVDYALSPEVKFPVALEQVVDVVGWLREAGAGLGVDTARLAIGGDSAGGNLSITTCLALRDQGRGGEIGAMLLNYAVLARQSGVECEQRYGGPDYMLTTSEMDQFWANYLTSPDEAFNPLANPSLADLRGLPPVFLAVAQCDLLAGQSLTMTEQLRVAGVSVRTKVYPGACHSFLEAVSIAAIAGEALEDGAAFLRERLAER